MGGAHLVIGLFAMYRMTKRVANPKEKQGAVTPAALHPSTSAIESMQQHAFDTAVSDPEDHERKQEQDKGQEK